MTNKNKLLRTKKALELACNKLEEVYSFCPLYAIGDEITRTICLKDSCDNDVTRCWKSYFYDLADKEGYKK